MLRTLFSRCQSIKEEKRNREEEEARRREEEEARRKEEEARRREEEETKRREEEEEEEARIIEEEEAKKREEEEEAKRREDETRLAAEAEAKRAMEEEEEAARRLKEKEESAKQALESEQQAAPLCPQAVVPEDSQEAESRKETPKSTSQPEPVVQTARAEECQDVQAQEEGRSPVQESSGSGEKKALDVPHPHAENGTQAEAGPEPELLESAQPQDNEAAPASPKEKEVHDTALIPEKEQESLTHVVPAASDATGAAPEKGVRAAPQQQGKAQVSRSQEKREMRRQRGLEHSQRELQRAASACKDDAPPRLKSQEPPSSTSTSETAEAKPKEHSDNKGLDQYTFVAWKDKGKAKESKSSSPVLVRPTTLPLDIPGPKMERNGHSEASSPLPMGTGSLPGHGKPSDHDRSERRKGKRGGEPSENISHEAQIPKSRKINSLRYIHFSSHCEHRSISS